MKKNDIWERLFGIKYQPLVSSRNLFSQILLLAVFEHLGALQLPAIPIIFTHNETGMWIALSLGRYKQNLAHLLPTLKNMMEKVL